MNSKLLSRTLTQFHNALFFRSYSANRTQKVTLYSKISPLGDRGTRLEPELENWVQNGNKVRVAELQRIVRDLRMRKRFTQALEVSEWMNKKGICIFSPTEHAVQLNLIGRVHGFVSAEDYFNNLREQDKTAKTYGALLNCYVRQRQTDKSVSLLEKMKKMGFASSPLTYNNIMCLYTNISQYEKIPSVLTEMKENNVSPDNFSYRLCIYSHGIRSDLEGMEKVLSEMEFQSHIVMDWNTYVVVANCYIKAGRSDKAIDALKKAEERLEKKDGIGYNHLISLYASLRNKAEVIRLWALEKNACKRCINRDFITVLESLVKLKALEEAEKVLKEWESSGNCYDFRVPNTVIIGYIGKGLLEEAEALLEQLVENGKATTPNTWGMLAAGYLYEDADRAKAFSCMKAALSVYVQEKGWKPNPRVVTGILNWLGYDGSPDDCEAFVAALRTVMPVNSQMYHALLKSYIRDGRQVQGLLNRMKADGIYKDEETMTILNEKPKHIFQN